MGKMHKLILVSFGFFSALTFHPVWGRVAAALVGIFIAVRLVSSMESRGRFLLILILPVLCFLVTTYAGNGLNNWLNDNMPEQVLGDVIYYFREAGIAAVPAVNGTRELVYTGNPDSLTSSGMKIHHFLMFFVSVFGAFALCFLDNKNRIPESLKARKYRNQS